MSDVFQRLTDRATGSSPGLSLRRPARFEVRSGQQVPGLLEGSRDPDVAVLARSDADRKADSFAESDSQSSTRPGRQQGRQFPSSGRRVPVPPASDGAHPQTNPSSRPATPATPPVRTEHHAEGRPGDAEPHRPAAQPAPSAPMPSAASDSRRPDPVRPRLRRAAPDAPEPVPAARAAALTSPPPADVLPADELLSEHVAPALADRGAVTRAEAAHLVAVGVGDLSRPTAGRIPVRLDPLDLPAGREVHVHIDRIDVSTPGPPAPAPAPAPARVDHAAYLDRQARRSRRP